MAMIVFPPECSSVSRVLPFSPGEKEGLIA
jgi:hypothetical protein